MNQYFEKYSVSNSIVTSRYLVILAFFCVVFLLQGCSKNESSKKDNGNNNSSNSNSNSNSNNEIQSFLEGSTSAYSNICLNNLREIDTAINDLKNRFSKKLNNDTTSLETTADQHPSGNLIRSGKLISSDNLISSGEGVWDSEESLQIINNVLTLIDNNVNELRLMSALSTKNKFRNSIGQCELSLLDKQQNLLSDHNLYSHLQNLDLSESLVTTQHFYNKLLFKFRENNAGNVSLSGDKQEVAELKKIILALKIKQRNCHLDNTLEACISISGDLLQNESKLSQLLGYPNPSMRLLDQTMALNEEVVVDFLSLLENKTFEQLKKSKDDVSLGNSNDIKIDYSSFRSGAFEAVTTLFGVEFIPVKESKNKSVEWQSETYDALKSGSRLGRLTIFYPSQFEGHPSNQFFPLQKGIHSTKNDQVPEGAIVLSLSNGNDTVSENPMLSLLDATQFVRLLGDYLAHLFSGEQQWILNSGVAVEADFKQTVGFVLQDWLQKPKLIGKLLANNSIEPDEYKTITTRLMRKSILKQIIKAQLRMDYLKISNDISIPEKERSIKILLKNILENYSIHLSEKSQTSLIKEMLLCESYCYESIWARAIATDMMTVINQWDELDEVMRKRFMSKVLMPGASRTAEDTVTDFLGRPYTAQPFLQYISQ